MLAGLRFRKPRETVGRKVMGAKVRQFFGKTHHASPAAGLFASAICKERNKHMSKTNYLRKRVLALFLALTMCLSLVQVTAFASEDGGQADTVITDTTGENEAMQPAKGMSSIKIQKSPNNAGKNACKTGTHCVGAELLSSGYNRLVDLVVAHDCENDGRHFLRDMANNIHIPHPLGRFLLVVSLKHGIVLHRSGAG